MYFNANLYHNADGWNCKILVKGKLAAYGKGKTQKSAFNAALDEAHTRFNGVFPPVEETD